MKLNNISENLEFFKSIMKLMAVHFGEDCEVVLHDLSKGLESSIVAIENGHVTGRKIGDPSSNLGMEIVRGEKKDDNSQYNYFTQTKSGKILRSSSIYFKNDTGEIIGSLCVNMDISDFMMAENAIKKITMPQLRSDIREVFSSDINEVLDYLLQECTNMIGKPAIQMTKEDKLKALKFLDEKGVFLIRKANIKVQEYLDISKFTLYSYLDEIRRENDREKKDK